MESLALLVVILFCAMFLCGPVALTLYYFKRYILAFIVGSMAVALGFSWYIDVYTWARFLGLASAACGLCAVVLSVKKAA
jgi:hypothetical protein